MTDYQIPKPTPAHVMVMGDDGLPEAVVSLDDIQSNAIKLAYGMASACGDSAALDDVSAFWIKEIGPDAFGLVAAGALRTLAQFILEPTLQIVEAIAPDMDLRAKLTASAENAEASL